MQFPTSADTRILLLEPEVESPLKDSRIAERQNSDGRPEKMTKTLCGGSAAALLLVSLTIYSDSSLAGPLLLNSPQPNPQQKSDSPPTYPSLDSANISVSKIAHNAGHLSPAAIDRPSESAAGVNSKPEPPSRSFVATAYNLRGRTASGKFVSRGLIAADRKMLPLGTRVRLDAGKYSGEYLVADTGGAIRGRIIDIWVPRYHEARRFGRRKVKLTVLGYTPKKVTRNK